MKKLNISEEVENRKYRIAKWYYRWFYNFVMGFFVRRQNAVLEIVDDPKDCKTGCFIIFNHLSRLDHMYVQRMVHPRGFNMVAEYNEFFRSHLHWAFKKQHIIPKKNYCNEIKFTKNIIQAIKNGHAIAFAPEGLASNDGQNKPIVPGTGKLFKKIGVPVYYCELHGQYLQATKVSPRENHGKVYAKMRLLFSPEQINELSYEQIDEIINKEFRRDEFAWQREQKIKWEMEGSSADKMEYLLYQCPECGKLFAMKTEGDTIKCEHCGWGARIDDYYDLLPLQKGAKVPEYITPWVNSQRVDIIKKIREDENFEFVENIKLGVLPNDHYLEDYKTSEIVDEGKLIINHSGVHFVGKGGYDFDIDYNQVYTTVTTTDATNFSFYINGEYREFHPERPATIYITYLIEEMHRLHVNYYKNFPWNEWMYEGK